MSATCAAGGVSPGCDRPAPSSGARLTGACDIAITGISPSAQVAALYSPEQLVGRQIVGVINFPEKQIGPFRSQFLLTGFPTDDGVVVTAVERSVPNGTRLA